MPSTPMETSANHVLERLTQCPKVRITSLCSHQTSVYKQGTVPQDRKKRFLFSAASAAAVSVFFLLRPPPGPAYWQLKAAEDDESIFFLKVNWPWFKIILDAFNGHFTQISGIIAVWEPLNILTRELESAMKKVQLLWPDVSFFIRFPISHPFFTNVLCKTQFPGYWEPLLSTWYECKILRYF